MEKFPRLRGGNSSAPGRERFGSGEQQARLRGAKRKVISLYFLPTEVHSPNSKIKGKTKETELS